MVQMKFGDLGGDEAWLYASAECIATKIKDLQVGGHVVKIEGSTQPITVEEEMRQRCRQPSQVEASGEMVSPQNETSQGTG